MNIEEIKEIQEKIKTAQNQAARAEGNQQQILSNLREEFGVSNVEEAEKLLDEIKTQQKECESELEILMEEIKNAMP
jgi:hypothetical protein